VVILRGYFAPQMKVQHMEKRLHNFFILLLCLLVQAELTAQTANVFITGLLTAKSGKGVPGAAITVRNESTGCSTSTTASDRGEYAFVQLPLGGPYAISISPVGFAPEKRTGYSLNQGDIMRVDVPMKGAG
jgi:hypothetical protein